MDRLDLELYAERLARLVTCAADDLADARLRLAWAELEDELAPGLAPDALRARIRVEGDDLRVLAWEGPPGPVD